MTNIIHQRVVRSSVPSSIEEGRNVLRIKQQDIPIQTYQDLDRLLDKAEYLWSDIAKKVHANEDWGSIVREVNELDTLLHQIHQVTEGIMQFTAR